MKTVYCTFDYVYVTFDSDVIDHNCVLSLKDEDCMFFVCDHNTTEEQFHEIESALFNKLNVEEFELSCAFYASQRRFYDSEDSYNECYRQRVESIKHEFETLNINDYNVYDV